MSSSPPIDIQSVSKQQEVVIPRNGGITRSEFQKRRQALAKALTGHSSAYEPGDREHLVIIPSAQRRYMVDKIPYFPFRQATDFRYLTGSLSHDSGVLMMFDDKMNEMNSILLVPNVDPRDERWEGPSMQADEACDLYGVDKAIFMDELPGVLSNWRHTKNLSLWYDYLNPSHQNVHRVVMQFMEGLDTRSQTFHSPRQHLHQLRLRKSPREIKATRQSAHIAATSIAEAIKTSRYHDSETKICAKLDYECRIRGADFLSYPPVVAAGENANIIHYTQYSDNPIAEGDLILVDCGCDFGGYTSDITRTWPLSGQFSQPQKLIYEAVLDVQESLIRKVAVDAGGETVDRLYKEMLTLLGEKLIDIGLIPRKIASDKIEVDAATREFCPHHVTHYLGLDVHDTALISRNIALEENMVITVEPGIYIPKRARSKYLSKVPDIFKGIGGFIYFHNSHF